ncbi:MAG: alpha/beta hydrolase [Candidatus Heimdallarchaeota archaeon]|nr:alpha/beta hydrolase [Candidatus Heimdallarchaeota archaeon]
MIFSSSFLGLFLSELGLWFSWIPLSLIIISIPFLIEYVEGIHPRWDFFILLISTLLNLISYMRLMLPFYQVSRTNRKLRKAMMNSLGRDYLDYIDPQLKKRFFRKVRFRLSHYLSGINYKKLDKEVVSVNDVPYRTIDDKTIGLNIYYPNKEQKNPVIVYAHGGGWMRGSKDRFIELRILKRLAYNGFTVFNIDYRLAPQPTFATLKTIPHDNPTIRNMVSDVRAAINFAKDNADKYQGDSEKLFIFGRSAGAHLALLTAFSCNEEFFDFENVYCNISPTDINGVIAFYPITDIDDLYQFYDKGNIVLKQAIYRGTGKLTEDKNLFRIFSPTSYINPENISLIPPIFLTAGKRDRIVDTYQSEELYNELQQNGITSVYLELPWANHGFDVVINGPGGQLTFQYMKQFMQWILAKQKYAIIERIAKKNDLLDVLTKNKIKILTEIKCDKSNEEIEACLMNLK